MDVVLGAAVTGPVARLALVDGSSSDRGEVIDESTVDLTADPAQQLAEAIVGTQRLLAQDGHRLAATRVCWSDAGGVEELRRRLLQAEITDVSSVSRAEAALAKVRGAGAGHAALLFCDNDTATLSIVDPGAPATVWATENVAGSDAATACTALLNRLGDHCVAAENLFLMGTSADLGDVATRIRATAPMPLRIPDDADLAFAHGATMAGFGADLSDAGASTAMIETPHEAFERPYDSVGTGATSVSPQIGPQLAYSMVDDSGSQPLLGTSGNQDPGDIPSQSRMSPLSWADDDDEDDDDTAATGAVRGRPRFLLLGSAAAAAVVIAFAALAITVAVGIRPDAHQVAIAQPKSHPTMPTFLPLPTNVAAPIPLNPDTVPTVEAQAPPVSDVGAAPLPASYGVPAEIPPGAPPPVALPDAPPASAGPQLPGWGMPGFQLPPIIFNIPSPTGQSATDWHWVTDGQSTRWWVPTTVQGRDLTAADTTRHGPGPDGFPNRRLPAPDKTPGSQLNPDPAGGTPTLAGTGGSSTGLNPRSEKDPKAVTPSLGGNSTGLFPNLNGNQGGPTPGAGGIKDAPPTPHIDIPNPPPPSAIPHPATPPAVVPTPAPVATPPVAVPTPAPALVPTPAPAVVPTPAPAVIPAPAIVPSPAPVAPVPAYTPKPVPVAPVPRVEEAPPPVRIPVQPAWTPQPALPPPPVIVPQPAPQMPSLPKWPVFSPPPQPMVPSIPSIPLFPKHH